MYDTIEVHDVTEENDIGGRKQIAVSAQHHDETIRSWYTMDQRWMPPELKLNLASVEPFDKVQVVNLFNLENRLIQGCFSENMSPTYHRRPLCRCGAMMVSDGFYVYCPNTSCGLTRAAHIKRLASTQFFDPADLIEHPELVGMHLTQDGFSQLTTPFDRLTQGLFWGHPGGSLEAILLKQTTYVTTLATFLVKDLFEEFLENPNLQSEIVYPSIEAIHHFYQAMIAATQRRDHRDYEQNKLLGRFIWSLGIDSVDENFINAMLAYELDTGCVAPMIVYGYLLANPQLLIQNYTVPALQASAVHRAVEQRAYEIHDILYEYAMEKSDITNTFKYMLIAK